MSSTWSKDPQKRPNFRAIVISLANLMDYGGDIESDLKMETKTCQKLKKVKPYKQVELSSKQHPRSLTSEKVHAYPELEEPIYSNENSLEQPEEYEVPVSSYHKPEGSLSLDPLEYEIPQSLSIDSHDYEVPQSHSSDPLEYEIPQAHSVDSFEYEVPQATGEEVIKSPPEVIPGKKLPPEVIPGKKSPPEVIPGKKLPPQRKLKSSPQSLGRAPVHRHNKTAIAVPIGIPDTSLHHRDDEMPHYEMSTSSTNGVSVTDTISSSEKPYSTLEWKKRNAAPADYGNFNSLPHKFSLKNRVYHTLEPPKI